MIQLGDDEWSVVPRVGQRLDLPTGASRVLSRELSLEQLIRLESSQ